MKMKRTQIPEIRKMLMAKQNGVCPVCKGDLTRTMAINIVIDHDHETGNVRAVMHRGCNKAEGSVLSTLRRWGKAESKTEVIKTLENLLEFWKLHKQDQTGITYYGHKTSTEKRLAVNKKRRKATAAKKEIK